MALRLPTAVLALLALVAVAAQAQLLFEETFDVHPKKKPDILEFEFFAEDGFWKNKLVECPGGRAGVSPDYDQCLDMALLRCKNKNAPAKGGCFRNEIGLLDEPDIFKGGDEHWIGTSFYVPKDYQPDRLKTVNIQIKANGGAEFAPSGPVFSLINQYGMWAVSIRGSSKCDFKCKIETAIVEFVAPVVPGAWVDFVYNTRLDAGGDGFGVLYMNGNKVFEQRNIQTAYKAKFGMFVKWGVYKHQWGEGEHEEFFDTDKTEIIVSAFRVAEGPNGYEKVDTSPSRRCTTPEACCNPCSPTYSHATCTGLCATSDSAACLMRTPCTSAADCCSKCPGGEPNWSYDPVECLGDCRSLVISAGSSSSKLKEAAATCGQLQLPTGCDRNLAGCSDGCQQNTHSFRCLCPDSKLHISNKFGNVCQEVKADISEGGGRRGRRRGERRRRDRRRRRRRRR